MIHNDQELAATQQRIVQFQQILAQLRITARREEFAAVTSGYRAELEMMQNAVLEYLSHHSDELMTSHTTVG